MEILFKIFICFLAGAGAGIGTGFAGMSAAAVIAPLLMTFLHTTPYQAIGIGLASDVLASAVSAWTYYKNENLDIKNSIILLITVIVMTVVGSFIGSLFPQHAMGNIVQFVMIGLGILFFFKPVVPAKKDFKLLSPSAKIFKSIFGGTIVGLICGFVGAGGGMMLLIVLTLLLEYEVHMAVGTSVFIMTFTALTGGVSHFFISGAPDTMCLILCVIFTFIWARIAAVIANKSNEKILNKVVGVVLFVTGIAILIVNKKLLFF